MKSKWYKDGLRFECTQCGNCCTGEPGFVWVNMEELTALADFLGEPLDQVMAVYTRLTKKGISFREKENGDCIFYDQKKGCTIYSVRPRQCKTWPFWKSNVETPQNWDHICQICPGSGKGELFSEEEITRRVKVIPL